jgi:Terpene synthase family 2, C-terminal metal binding
MSNAEPHTNVGTNRWLERALRDDSVRSAVAAVEADVRTAIGPWSSVFRNTAIRGVVTGAVLGAPGMTAVHLATVAKLGAWICAFDDLVDDGELTDAELDLRFEQFDQLLTGNECPELEFDPIARLFVDVLADLRKTRQPSLFELFVAQLRASLRGMRCEREALDRDGSVESYLQVGADSICMAPVITAAALLLGELELSEHIGSFTAAEHHASVAVRIANDLATWSRERQEKSANVLRLTGDIGVTALRNRIAVERGIVHHCVAGLRRSVPRTAEFMLNLTEFFLNTYDVGDLDQDQFSRRDSVPGQGPKTHASRGVAIA